jgi:hypothetical protein
MSDRNIKYAVQINYILSFEEVTLKFISAGEQVLFMFLASFFLTHWPFKLYEIEEIAIFLFQKSLVFMSRKSLLLLYLKHLCV